MLSLEIDPTNPLNVFAGTWAFGVYRTTNGGNTWTNLPFELRSAYVNALLVDPNDGSVIFRGAGGGLFKSTDSGDTWEFASQGMSATRVNDVVVTANAVLAATQGSGVARNTGDGLGWFSSNTGLINTWIYAFDVHPVNHAVAYLASRSDPFGGRPRGAYWSIDDGEIWELIDTWSLFNPTEILIDPNTPNVVFVVDDLSVLRSDDNGSTWNAKTTGLTGIAQALAMDQNNSTFLVAGTSNAGVFYTDDSGETWNQFNNGLSDFNVQTIAIHPNQTWVFVGTHSGGVFKWSAGSWMPLNSGLPDLNVQALIIDNTADGSLYAGTASSGVYYFGASGAESWVPVATTELASPNVHSLTLDTTDDWVLYAGTNGGVFVHQPLVFSDGFESGSTSAWF